MKLFVIIQCTNLGGMEQSALLLFDELKRMGHDVELLSLNQMGKLQPMLARLGVPASSLGYHGVWGWRSFLPLRSLLKTKHADAVLMIGHNLMAMLALSGLGSGRRVLCMHFHHTGVKPAWMWRLIYWVALSRFQAIVFPSRFIRDEAETISPTLRLSRRTCSYPIPLPILVAPEQRLGEREAALAEFGIPAGAKVVGNAGWLIPRKRWDVFLQVAARVASKVPGSRFLIAGDGPEMANLKLLAKTLAIEDRIHWLGWQDNLDSFFRGLDVLLFNSDWDAMGRTPLEAMAHGVPIVASVVHGGLSEIIDKEEYGTLINTHDVAFLARKTIQLLEDEGFARAVGARGRRRVEEVGSPRLHAERIMSVLNRNGSFSESLKANNT